MYNKSDGNYATIQQQQLDDVFSAFDNETIGLEKSKDYRSDVFLKVVSSAGVTPTRF